MLAANARITSSDDEKIIRELLKYKADVNAKNKAGETALSLAASWNGKENIVKLLKEAGAK